MNLPISPTRRQVLTVWRWRARPALRIGAEICPGQPLEQLGGAALGDTSATVDHEVLGKPDRVVRSSLDRQRDPRVPTHVPHLPVLGQMCRDDLVSVKADPSIDTCGRPSGSIVTRCANAGDSRTERAASKLSTAGTYQPAAKVRLCQPRSRKAGKMAKVLYTAAATVTGGRARGSRQNA